MSSVGEGLARMVARGLITVEQLDHPTLGWEALEQDRRRSLASDLSPGWPGRRTPAFRYPDAGRVRPLRNLAREWIAANPKAWAAILEHLVARDVEGQPAPQPPAPQPQPTAQA